MGEKSRLDRNFVTLNRPRLEPAITAIRQIEALGFSPADVRHILLTHMDVDHTGGIADFPAAKVHVYAKEHAAAMVCQPGAAACAGGRPCIRGDRLLRPRPGRSPLSRRSADPPRTHRRSRVNGWRSGIGQVHAFSADVPRGRCQRAVRPADGAARSGGVSDNAVIRSRLHDRSVGHLTAGFAQTRHPGRRRPAEGIRPELRVLGDLARPADDADPHDRAVWELLANQPYLPVEAQSAELGVNKFVRQ